MRLAALNLAAVLFSCLSAQAEPANVKMTSPGEPGAASRIVIAQKAYAAALRSGDGIVLLAAIRLARGVTLRQPIGWTKTTTGDVPTDQQQLGRASPPDPSLPQAIAIVQSLAKEDPALQELVYDLDAQMPRGRRTTAIRATSDLAGGQTDTWKLALSGHVPAEIGVVGDGDSPLAMTVADDSGAVVCAVEAGYTSGICRLTPARNGFFSVTVRNPGQVWNQYWLIGS